MIEYLKDIYLQGEQVTSFKITPSDCPYILKDVFYIIRNNGKTMRCPCWKVGKEILKFDKEYIYVKSDNAGKVDVFDEMGVKVKEIDVKDLG